jgi:D-alanyl-D-alanine carboxypeptidase/D-alanyl-D-alanine-endopeptidase (penicillin-binding protein 4)
MNYSTFKTLKNLFLLLLLVAAFSSCSANKQISRKLGKEFKNSSIISQYQVGFELYDPLSKDTIFQKDASKYYTPASNTKLYTFYAGLKMIPDSIPSLRYIEKGDSLIFWGTGDPSFLQSQLKGAKALEFLKASTKKLYFAAGRYTGNFYGNGWSWDDYNDYYQAEISELPIMGNMVDLGVANGQLTITPNSFSDCFILDSAMQTENFMVKRDFNVNEFRYPKLPVPLNYTQQVPYKINTSMTLSLLSDTLHKTVEVIKMAMPADAKTIYNLKTEDVLRAMMLPSDNFIAEQLLLVYSNQISADLSTDKAIAHIEKNYLQSLPDPPHWVDGSGLSRGDLFTPRDMITILDLIYKEVNNPEKLFSLLPAGGQSGTLKNAYPRTAQPFVFGKTGSLSNVHNQSGYVNTKKGKTYIFSFMNNNFVLPTATVRKEMVRIMTYIHENF